MKNKETLSRPPLEETLPTMLDNRTVKRNHVGMFHIGKVLLHESAYAVYHQKDGSLKSTLLHKPDFKDNPANSDEEEWRRHKGINVAKLVATQPNFANKKGRAFGTLSTEQKISQSSEEVQRTIANIQSSFDLDGDEKYSLIEALLDKDFTRRTNIETDLHPRTDIAMVVHNHPQPNVGSERTSTLLQPSGADIISTTDAALFNPGLVEGIVAADYKNTAGMLLFGPEANREQDPEGYAAHIEYRSDSRYTLSQLALRGYSYLSLELDKHGAVAEKHSDEITDFARSIKQ